MEIEIQEISQETLSDAEKCNNAFLVNSKIVLAARNNVIEYTIVSRPPYQKHYPPETIEYTEYVNNHDQTAFIAYLNSEIAGQIRLRRNWNHYAYIENIVVDSEFRRRGIGLALIRKAIDWAKGKQLSGLMLETQNNNVAACLFYECCGFEVGGFDRLLYKGQDPATEEIALYWYLIFKAEEQ